MLLLQILPKKGFIHDSYPRIYQVIEEYILCDNFELILYTDHRYRQVQYPDMWLRQRHNYKTSVIAQDKGIIVDNWTVAHKAEGNLKTWTSESLFHNLNTKAIICYNKA